MQTHSQQPRRVVPVSHETPSQMLDDEQGVHKSADTSKLLTPQRILSLQRTIGNQATMRLLDQRGVIQRHPIIQREPDEESDSGGGADEAVDEAPEQENDAEDEQALAEVESVPEDAADVSATVSNQPAPVAVDVGPDDDDDDGSVASDQSADDGAQQNNQPSAIGPQHRPHEQLKTGQMKVLGVGTINTGLDKGFGAAVKGGNTAVSLSKTGDNIKTATDVIKEGKLLHGQMPSDINTADEDMVTSAVNSVDGLASVLEASQLTRIVSFTSFVYYAHGTFVKLRHMKAFKKMAVTEGSFDADSKQNAKKRDTALQDLGTIGNYGYNKTKRGVGSRLAKAIVSLGQFIARMVSVLSGLSAAVVSEGVDLALALAKGAVKLGETVKALWKIITKKRGKRRAEASNKVVDSALNGDEVALQFMVDAHALSKAWFAKMFSATKTFNPLKWASNKMFVGLKRKLTPEEKTLLNTRPESKEDMLKYLTKCEELGLTTKLKRQVADTMKST